MNSILKKFFLVCALFVSLCANAQDKATLDLLVSKGLISRQEADELSKKATVVDAKQSTTKSVKLSGRIQVQYQNIHTSETVGGVSNDLNTTNNFLLRRAFLGMEADLGSGWSANVVADLCRSSEGYNYLENAYVSKKFNRDIINGTADIGYKKIIFNIEEYTSNSKLFTPERSLASRFFSEGNNGRRLGIGGRHTGIFWQGKIQEFDGLKYGFSITNSYNNYPASAPEYAKDGLLYAGNVAYEKKFENKSSFEIGLNFAYTNATNTAGTKGNANGEIIAFNPYLKARYDNFSLWTEVLTARMSDAINNYTNSSTPVGINVGLEYRFDIGELGQVSPTFRYSWLDTDGRGIKASDGIRNADSNGATFDWGQSIYLGFKWYIIGDDLKFQMGYEWAQLEDSPTDSTQSQRSTSNAVRAQMQILF